MESEQTSLVQTSEGKYSTVYYDPDRDICVKVIKQRYSTRQEAFAVMMPMFADYMVMKHYLGEYVPDTTFEIVKIDESYVIQIEQEYLEGMTILEALAQAQSELLDTSKIADFLEMCLAMYSQTGRVPDLLYDVCPLLLSSFLLRNLVKAVYPYNPVNVLVTVAEGKLIPHLVDTSFSRKSLHPKYGKAYSRLIVWNIKAILKILKMK